MNTVVIIPARYASTRLPGKPLLRRTGKYLIQHVTEAASAATRVDGVYVATDDQRIVEAVESFGGQAIMTSADCRTGSDRLAEAAKALGLADEDIIVNVQGDEPDIPPECIDAVINALVSSEAPMATLATPISAEDAEDPNRVKLVCDSYGMALYFSRAKIPYDRDHSRAGHYLLHLGVYAYRSEFLRLFTTLESTPAERSESLEQLRALEHGYRIVVSEVDYDGAGIDTPADYAAFVARAAAR